MKADYCLGYGTHSDEDRGVRVWGASLDDSLEEREEIAESVCEALLGDGEINLNRFSVTLVHTERSNCRYSEQCDEVFCDEDDVEFSFEVSPFCYMDIVIPRALEQVNDGWGVEEMASLLYLERDLIEAKYEGKELAELARVVEPFREVWKCDFLGE